jgi:purine-binding chemotaxis protein CheW
LLRKGNAVAAFENFALIGFVLHRISSGTRLVHGTIVDGVSDVISLGADDIRPAPKLGTAFDADFLLGIGAIDGRMLILLDIERMMSSEELGLVERLAA